MAAGIVTTYPLGSDAGVITGDDGSTVHVHRYDVEHDSAAPVEGARVEYRVADRSGELHAEAVRVLAVHPAALAPASSSAVAARRGGPWSAVHRPGRGVPSLLSSTRRPGARRSSATRTATTR